MSVGGSIGLFVGASLLTVVEIFYYFIIRPLGDRYIKYKRRKEVKKLKLDAYDFYYNKHGTLFEFVN